MPKARSRGPATLLATVLIATLAATVHAAPSRDTFLAAEQALADGHPDTARTLMRSLGDYPLVGYLELALARAEVATLPHERIEAVLRRHRDLPAAAGLRRDWLERLARESRDETLLEHFADEGHTPSACLAAQAEWRTRRTAEAWARVERLWQTGQSLPDQCDPVLAAWRDAGRLTAPLAWQRFGLAVEAGNIRLARYLLRYLSPDARALGEQWLALRAAPGGLAAFARSSPPGDDPRRARVLQHVFARAARGDTRLGREIWRSLAGAGLPPALRESMREDLGEALARQREPDALEWLQTARGTPALTARAVEGIRLGRLDDVAAAVAAMPPEEGSRERWRYWQARGMAESDPQGARERLAALAGERSYYGFVAADRVGAPYAFGDAEIPATAEQIEAVARLAGAVRAREWLALDRPEEARREWAQLIGALDTPGRLSAARLAHRWQWHEAAIRSAAAAEHWSDLALRFPLAHEESIRQAAAAGGLPASRVYAVVRQESAFMRDIRSSAGALGLMQLMPATARLVARRAGLPSPNRVSILEPGQNLLLGSLYLRRLEQRYDGHPVLATAAYNAGPGRVRQWREQEFPMNSEAWIETIPFRETRRYVRSVLAYQIIYAQRLGERALRISELMPEVPPG